MPFEISPKIIVNPWVINHPEEARALADLAGYLRTIPRQQWNFRIVHAETDCGTVGCAMGHACYVPSCAAIGVQLSEEDGCVNETAFRLPCDVRLKFFYNYPVIHPSAHDVADRIEHWLATGEIK